ncbi:MAG: hypothetical protein AVDCRST_MAG70-413 [uncultured Thermomicrobiales bacterium]|uniref:Uncharacterized protein n=1 Tax=uncultured Thermomicrobiales bacterium TaxID=1645740 RepID=A0A6J4UA24_9BACT|nr:MAG: hypothetical protein AVDCRST_MAG70-413 [uncultured Thermomicrobiales bacterium]
MLRQGEDTASPPPAWVTALFGAAGVAFGNGLRTESTPRSSIEDGMAGRN